MTTVNEEGKALVEQSTFDKSKALAEFMEYIHTYLTDDECDQVLKLLSLLIRLMKVSLELLVNRILCIL